MSSTSLRTIARTAAHKVFLAFDEDGRDSFEREVADAVTVAVSREWALAIAHAGFNPDAASPLQHHGPCGFWKDKPCNCPISKLDALLSALAVEPAPQAICGVSVGVNERVGFTCVRPTGHDGPHRPRPDPVEPAPQEREETINSNFKEILMRDSTTRESSAPLPHAATTEAEIDQELDTILAKAPRWFTKCRKLEHRTSLSDLSHRGPEWVGAIEYFCNECSRGESKRKISTARLSVGSAPDALSEASASPGRSESEQENPQRAPDASTAERHDHDDQSRPLHPSGISDGDQAALTTEARCEGRWQESFDAAYRCRLPQGHAGPHQSDDGDVLWIDSPGMAPSNFGTWCPDCGNVGSHVGSCPRSPETHAKRLEQMAGFLRMLVPVALKYNGEQPHWESERIAERDACEAGAQALRRAGTVDRQEHAVTPSASAAQEKNSQFIDPAAPEREP